MFHLTVVFLLWSAAFAGAATIGGFSFGQTLTYFVMLIVLQFFIGAFNEDYQISEDIRNGLINQFLLKPINYYLYRFSIFSAARLVSGALVLVPLGVALPVFLADRLTFHPEAWRLACAVLAMALAALIQFTIAYCFGLLTFWFLEIQSFVILSLAVESVLGGQIFPLDLLPARAIFRVAQFTPFYYQMYFPAAILTGRIGLGALGLRGLGAAGGLGAGPPRSGASALVPRPPPPHRGRRLIPGFPPMLYYLRIWLAGARYSIVRTLMFRGDFFIWSLVELFWMSVNLLLIAVIYQHTSSVAGWNEYQMVLLVGTGMLVQRLLMGFFWTNLFEMARNIRTGAFDFFLAQPGHPLFMASTRKLDPDGLANSLVAIGVVIFAAHRLHLHPSVRSISRSTAGWCSPAWSFTTAFSC